MFLSLKAKTSLFINTILINKIFLLIIKKMNLNVLNSPKKTFKSNFSFISDKSKKNKTLVLIYFFLRLSPFQE